MTGLFAPGDRVSVLWMDERREATIVSRERPRGGKPSDFYRVEIEGVKAHPFYGVGEMTPMPASANGDVSSPPKSCPSDPPKVES